MCGGGGDGGGEEGGLGRKASRQLISAPLSSLKGSGLLYGGALGFLRFAFGLHVDAVSFGVPAEWCWCHELCDLLLCTKAWQSPLLRGARQGGRSEESQKAAFQDPGMLNGQEKQLGRLLCRTLSLRQVF